MQPKWNRLLVGCLAATFLFSGLAIGLFDSWGNLWCGSLIRASLLLGAFWLGMPTKGRAAAWANFSPLWIVAIAVGMVLLGKVIQRPQILIPFAGLFFTLMWLWPWLTGANRRS